MWLILQQDKPDDYVVGTGETHSVKEFLVEAFHYAGLDWEKHVRIDQRYFRPTEVEVLIANSSKAKKNIGWEPKVHFKELVRIMVDADMEAAGLQPAGEGKAILIKNGLSTVW
jgi:GDPmannose 4,6-dehydratase